jgi:alditol oxidase
MNKRQFLKASGAFVAGTVLPRPARGEQQGETRTDWAGNYTYRAKRLDIPKSVEEVREVAKKRSTLKALGARHSFNAIADSTGDQVSLRFLDQMAVDARSHTVTVGGGVTYAQLGPYLDSQGFALRNLASLPHISVAGACATATHGSGNRNGNLATAVSAMEVVKADGEVVVLSRERDERKVPGGGGPSRRDRHRDEAHPGRRAHVSDEASRV